MEYNKVSMCVDGWEVRFTTCIISNLPCSIFRLKLKDLCEVDTGEEGNICGGINQVLDWA